MRLDCDRESDLRRDSPQRADRRQQIVLGVVTSRR
jgi:hypothetical protein